MAETVKLFMSKGAQAVRLPKHYRFDAKEVSIRRNSKTGEVILTPRPSEASARASDWSELKALLDKLDEPDDFLDVPRQPADFRDPFRDLETG